MTTIRERQQLLWSCSDRTGRFVASALLALTPVHLTAFILRGDLLNLLIMAILPVMAFQQLRAGRKRLEIQDQWEKIYRDVTELQRELVEEVASSPEPLKSELNKLLGDVNGQVERARKHVTQARRERQEEVER